MEVMPTSNIVCLPC